MLLYQNADDLRIGQPLVEGARVLGEVVEQTSVKLYIQHFRRRKNYRRLRGHRQHYTRIQVRNILLPGQEPPVAPPPAPTGTETLPRRRRRPRPKHPRLLRRRSRSNR